MNTFFWILTSTLLMSLIAWVGLFTLYLKEDLLKRIILPLVAFSAGSLLAGAFLHMIPEAIEMAGPSESLFLVVIIGFTTFFLMEQFIHWHHCHKTVSEHKTPVTYLILVSDALHNFIGGLAIGGAFIVDVRLGIITWLVSAAHEIPQEFGDFGILVHGGWERKKALLFNFLSALTIVVGGVVVYFFSDFINLAYLLAFAAGNFVYIASSDLIPEIKHSDNFKENITHFVSFAAGVFLIFLVGQI